MTADKPDIPLDPNLVTEQQQAAAQSVQATQAMVAGDSASLMARFGTRLALNGTMAAPMAVATGAGGNMGIGGAAR